MHFRRKLDVARASSLLYMYIMRNTYVLFRLVSLSQTGRRRENFIKVAYSILIKNKHHKHSKQNFETAKTTRELFDEDPMRKAADAATPITAKLSVKCLQLERIHAHYKVPDVFKVKQKKRSEV